MHMSGSEKLTPVQQVKQIKHVETFMSCALLTLQDTTKHLVDWQQHNFAALLFK